MTRRGLFAPLLGLLFGGTACAPLRLAAGGAGTDRLRYGDDPRQTVEIHAPPRAEDRPVLVLFHGGDRYGPDRARARDAARALAKRGFVVVLADMRTGSGLGSGAAFIEDAAAATAWAGDRAAEFGGDPARLGVLGRGVGADAALMIALDRRYMASRGRPDLIRAAASWGRPDPARDPTLTQPEAYVRADAPPVWLIDGGEADAALAARIRAVGGRVEVDAGQAAPLDGTTDFLRRALAPLSPGRVA